MPRIQGSSDFIVYLLLVALLVAGASAFAQFYFDPVASDHLPLIVETAVSG